MAAVSDPTAWLFPGQGSQKKGMGEELFASFPDHVACADRVLGYSIVELCLGADTARLTQTQFAQPALFVVNALSFYDKLAHAPPPDFVAGHSLGEFNALLAARCFDFETGVRLVATRGRLMSAANGGSMAAVIGLEPAAVREELGRCAVADRLFIANVNSARQIVVSGEADAVRAFAAAALQRRFARVVPLAVSAAFHSPYMAEAAKAFADILRETPFDKPAIPVLANATGTFYEPDRIRETLARQIDGTVRWREQMASLRRAGVRNVEQVGPGAVCADLWREALAEPVAAPAGDGSGGEWKGLAREPADSAPSRPTAAASGPPPSRSRLGDAFCRKYGVSHPYVAGSMYRGIASPALVSAMARAGFLAFLGAGGLPVAQVRTDIRACRESGVAGRPFGVNLLASPDQPGLLRETVEMLLSEHVDIVEASGFTGVTEDVVAYRFAGAAIDGARAHCRNRLFAKLSRIEVANEFMRPPSEKMLKGLVDAGRLDEQEAAAARRLPVCSDLSVEADSGGHTDGGVMLTLLPSILRLRARLRDELRLDEEPLVGAAGGIGTPEAIASCFVLGADFVLCGSIHQCTPEAGTSDAVKDLLAGLGVSDTGYAPAGDMFITGARVQVVRRGTLFAARANHLYDLYRSSPGLASIAPGEIEKVERYLGAPVTAVWESCRARLAERRPDELERIGDNPKARMARVFKTYFSRTILTALDGDLGDKVNWQIHSGPAIGAFNAFAETIGLADWRARKVDLIASELIARAAHHAGTA